MKEELHNAALRMARQCRRIVQGALLEWEIADCEAEFYAVILQGLKELEDAPAINGQSDRVNP